ncbi:hypothetical protein KVR01_002172 [Diaporthe batatas]|uniref:uncharacterized protein n=1 Tax=Diaporthe batatas TaxID=748121 RepID=UPI001D03998E|nr:uncharacterized protein KVR01_002172 [Diaporthe batatas]KAG8166483.1 hypothetical protein KVR01_002172 [Diaporthe batatas]
MSGQRVLRSFPLALNLGADICHITRIRRILESPRASRFVQRILNDEERSHPKIQCILNKGHSPSLSRAAKTSCAMGEHHTTAAAAAGVEDHSPSTAAPNLDELQLAATFMAGRFAAKEAVIKAHPQKNLTWHGITISHQASTHADRKGAPAAIIRGTNEDYEALISISHDGDYASAVCLGARHAEDL